MLAKFGLVIFAIIVVAIGMSFVWAAFGGVLEQVANFPI